MEKQQELTRREFLKLAGLTPLSLALPRFDFQSFPSSQSSGQKNIIVIVFDALSALNISFLGYARETMPNLARLADQSIVYHNHYSAGNFTTPGTASLLTGTYPWTHRALQVDDTVASEFVSQNIFSFFPKYHRIAYTHNLFANTLLKQFYKDIDDYTPRKKLFLVKESFPEKIFKNDIDTALLSWFQAFKKGENKFKSYSLFFSKLDEICVEVNNQKLRPFSELFPVGLPYVADSDDFYILETAIDDLILKLGTVTKPFFGYYHLYPPHKPYRTRNEFVGKFMDDGFVPLEKPANPLSDDRTTKKLNTWRREYDEFILYADSEFARLYDFMDQSGFLDNTWLILTSDHGELFERGIWEHITPALYQPVVKVPLLIFEPGRKSRLDIHANTSSVDLLPTLLYLDGQSIPSRVEGEILPPFSPFAFDSEHNVFTLEAKKIQKGQPLTQATVMLIRGQFKLIYYFGYEKLGSEGELIELYDLVSDPEELNNLYPGAKELAQDILAVIKAKIIEANEPYQ